MDIFALFTSTQGRLARKPFALGAVGVYVAGFAAQALLAPGVTSRAGIWPFIAVQAALLWAWLVLHIRRLRDAGQGPAGAIGVALIYALALGLLLMLIAFLTNPNAPSAAAEGAEPSTSDAAYGTLLIVVIVGLLFMPDFGVFTTILKILIFLACLPGIISVVFSVTTGMRASIPPPP